MAAKDKALANCRDISWTHSYVREEKKTDKMTYLGGT